MPRLETFVHRFDASVSAIVLVGLAVSGLLLVVTKTHAWLGCLVLAVAILTGLMDYKRLKKQRRRWFA